MIDTDCDTVEFERHRRRLLGIAYRMLGEMSAAEDVMQDAWLRWQRADRSEIRDTGAWLAAATVRLSLDALRKVRARREVYVGPWLPEPILPDDVRALTVDGLATRAELASDLSLALLHVLERLSPDERAAFVMHEAFGCEYAEIAATLNKSEPACRKLVSRAKERVKMDRPRYTVSADQHHKLVQEFLSAVAAQDPKRLAEIFAPDVAFYSDGGGRVSAALRPILGMEKVSRLFLGLVRKLATQHSPQVETTDINGRPGMLAMMDGEIYGAFAFEAEDQRITAIYSIRNPDKLARVSRVLSASQVFEVPNEHRNVPALGSRNTITVIPAKPR